ncbi:Tn3 family transposase, partial [Paraburkholderia sp. BR13439]|uniref:Tn3 family transposase n=2 Tax=unclassified Paraburkholderia TaxID=2615204 RepID=UPI0034D01E82
AGQCRDRLQLGTALTTERYQREGNEKALAMLKKISPVAWRHIHFLGHYTFRNENPIDIAAMLAGLDLL